MADERANDPPPRGESIAHCIQEAKMHAGMLWYDNAPEIPFEKRLETAANFYRRKYGRLPNLCLIHPSMLNSPHVRLGAITVRAYAPIVRGALWIGVEDVRRAKTPRIRSRRQMPVPGPCRA